MKYLLDNGYLHGDCMTVTGKTLAENLADVAPLSFEDDQDVIYPKDKALKSSGNIQIIYGNLAAEGAVAKIRLWIDLVDCCFFQRVIWKRDIIRRKPS